MGTKDDVTRAFMEDPAVFADVFNFSVYGGEQVVQPEELVPMDPALTFTAPVGQALQTLARRQDVVKSLVAKADGRRALAVLGVENQSQEAWDMVVRVMLYTAMHYDAQVKSLAEKGSLPTGRTLTPVLVRVVLYGSAPWRSPLTLKGMMRDAPTSILAAVQDFEIQVIQPARLSEQDLALFRSDLGPTMGWLKHAGDDAALTSLRERDSRFSRLGTRAVRVIEAFTDVKIGEGYGVVDSDGRECVDMCKAIDDMKAKSRAEGIGIGRAEGIGIGRAEGARQASLDCCRNLLGQKVLSTAQIAEALRLPLETVQRMADELHGLN